MIFCGSRTKRIINMDIFQTLKDGNFYWTDILLYAGADLLDSHCGENFKYNGRLGRQIGSTKNDSIIQIAVPMNEFNKWSDSSSMEFDLNKRDHYLKFIECLENNEWIDGFGTWLDYEGEYLK